MFKDTKLREELKYTIIDGTGNLKGWVDEARSFFEYSGKSTLEQCLKRSDIEVLQLSKKLDLLLDYLNIELVKETQHFTKRTKKGVPK